jgi:hypothetical protein
MHSGIGSGSNIIYYDFELLKIIVDKKCISTFCKFFNFYNENFCKNNSPKPDEQIINCKSLIIFLLERIVRNENILNYLKEKNEDEIHVLISSLLELIYDFFYNKCSSNIITHYDLFFCSNVLMNTSHFGREEGKENRYFDYFNIGKKFLLFF